MKYIFLILSAMTGLTVGLVWGISQNGFSNGGVTFLWGLTSAVLFALLQIDLVSRIVEWRPRPSSNSHVKQQSRKRLRPKPGKKARQETEGAFAERMERFSNNLEQREPTPKSKMPFWTAIDTTQCQRTSPKSLELIRALLQRIRKVLSSG